MFPVLLKIIAPSNPEEELRSRTVMTAMTFSDQVQVTQGGTAEDPYAGPSFEKLL